MSTFTDAFKNEANKTFTENGCEAYKSTDSYLLDLFATIGALRSRSDKGVVDVFAKAYAENPEYATKCLFYGRDVRGGCGERKTFRVIFKWLADKHPEAVKPNIKYVGEYGRFDDLYCLVGTSCEKEMWAFMKEQFEADLANLAEDKPISLLAKWIKSPDASSFESRKLGKLTAKNLGYSVYDFKRVLRKLRKVLNLVETSMCENKWDEINYSSVPSRAMMIYRNAFGRHDKEGFAEYVAALARGEEKVNASTLYPYDIVGKFWGYEPEQEGVLEAQWKALPNYLVDAEGNPVESNIIVMADVSGSMNTGNGRPMHSSVGLALYFAERNQGAFHNMFMTFDSNPKFCMIAEGTSLKSKVRDISRADWGGSTNFYGALMSILDMCVAKNVAPEDVPKALVCISDMEFDCASAKNYSFEDGHRSVTASWDMDIYARANVAFEEKGYTLPKIVFWNVDSRNDTFHTDKLNIGTLCVSGQSPSAFKAVINCLNMTPYEAMMTTLDSERYAPIKIN